MKTARQALTAAVVAFKNELYTYTAREPKAIAIALDDELFDRLALTATDDPLAADALEHGVKCEDVDRLELHLADVRVVVRRFSGRQAARIAVARMAVSK